MADGPLPVFDQESFGFLGFRVGGESDDQTCLGTYPAADPPGTGTGAQRVGNHLLRHAFILPLTLFQESADFIVISHKQEFNDLPGPMKNNSITKPGSNLPHVWFERF
jgi:hypothetical protein